MKKIRLIVCILLLLSCSKTEVTEVDLSPYFKGINGTAVFYQPTTGQYKIHNLRLSGQRASPCSTFKIISAGLALSENLINTENSKIKWNKKRYDMPAWNKDMTLKEAFQTSCVWYFRNLIDRLPQAKIQAALNRLDYGNKDISDWKGDLNTNTNSPKLKGFWIESSLQISPMEQVRSLAKLFSSSSPAEAATLKDLMQTTDTPVKIYGKTGLGIKDNQVHTAWFVGFFEQDSAPVYFAVRLTDEENPIPDYRHKASQYARQIAIDIISNADLF
ncbi:MAG: penicillin-binding transpeptidase domain-containing protein [Alphaproteobacteria bacterium]|nr:penicillin-binding transpeptidase domain-containing protein [Alphaproteobacteria bacterium]